MYTKEELKVVEVMIIRVKAYIKKLDEYNENLHLHDINKVKRFLDEAIKYNCAIKTHDLVKFGQADLIKGTPMIICYPSEDTINNLL